MEHHLMVSPSASPIPRSFFCSRISLKGSHFNLYWHTSWSTALVQIPKACVKEHRQKFIRPTPSRINLSEKAHRDVSVYIYLSSERTLASSYHSRAVAISNPLETPEDRHDHKYGHLSENSSAVPDNSVTELEHLKLLRADSIRSKLVLKLSEANQHSRNLGRRAKETSEALSKCQTELAMMEVELEVLVKLAQEIARNGGKQISKKINGRFISSHLALRLEDLHKRLLSQIKDVDAVRLRDVPLEWHGMAESVQVMGSFDGWSQGEYMSQENTMSHTLFTTTLRLPPGKYEIKFLVDGVWQLSPQLPTVGEGMTINNLLVVE